MTVANEAEQAANRELMLNHIIDAPREIVFKAWTDPELLDNGSHRCLGPHLSQKSTLGKVAWI